MQGPHMTTARTEAGPLWTKTTASAALVMALAGLSLSLGGCASSDDVQGTELSTDPAPRSTALSAAQFASTDASKSANIDTTKPAASPASKTDEGGRMPRSAADPDVAVLPGVGNVQPLKPAPVQPSASTTTPARPRLNTAMASSIGQDQPGAGNAVATPGGPQGVIQNGAQPTSAPVTVDALVGQINGKPVYASAVLSDLDARLSASAEKLKESPTAWNRDATVGIFSKLKNDIDQELLLQEARSVLSPEERKGLFAFLANVRENLIREQGGSEQEANDRLMNTEDLTLDLKAQNERDVALIRMIYQRFIIPRVNVSWRDVQVEYERNSEKYNPGGTVVLRMIWVPKKDPAVVQSAKDAIAARSFEDVAGDAKINDFSASSKGIIESRFKGADPMAAPLLAFDELDSAVKKLTVGQVAGPIDFRSGRTDYLGWVKLEAINREKAVTLADAQLDIYRSLRQRRLQAEAERFFQRIREKGARTNEIEMTSRLLTVAQQRYLGRTNVTPQPPTPPTPSAPTQNAPGTSDAPGSSSGTPAANNKP
jgi:hypothetical protein